MTRLFVIDYLGLPDEEMLLAAQSRFISEKRKMELDSLGIDVCSRSKFKQKYMDMTDARTKEIIKEKLGAELMIAAAMRSMGLEYLPPKYERTNNGMPWCREAFFSVSHTKGIVCSVIGNKPVGVDVEFKRTINEGIARRLLSKDEQSEYAVSESRNDFLLRHWTAKESCLKLSGRGIETNMRLLTVDEKCSIIIEQGMDGEIKNEIPLAIIDSKEMRKMGFNTCDCLIAVSGAERSEIEIQVFNGFDELIEFLGGGC